MEILDFLKKRLEDKTTWIGVVILILACYPCCEGDYMLKFIETISQLIGGLLIFMNIKGGKDV